MRHLTDDPAHPDQALLYSEDPVATDWPELMPLDVPNLPLP